VLWVVAALASVTSVTACGNNASSVSNGIADTLAPLPPPARKGPLGKAVISVLPLAVSSLQSGTLDSRLPVAIGNSRDGRLGWILSDLLRFTGGGPDADVVLDAFDQLTGTDVRSLAKQHGTSPWQETTDLLIMWDPPAPPGYQKWKSELFLALESRWKPIFNDENADIDWRYLSWGGVQPDLRRLGDNEPCIGGCIPALDDPLLTNADAGNWYPDDRIVFGITLGDESIAFPKNIMEVHEMVNLTISGRRVAIPYCTLCGSAEAFFTDRVASAKRPLVLRTSGLLSLSNKVMIDLDTLSAFDTFKGRAVSGELRDAGVILSRLTTVTSRWDAWRDAHPNTKIVARDGGIGRKYELDPLGSRDVNGPIFPIRRTDQRLPVQTQVLGVIAGDGTPVAFPVDAARSALESGRLVTAHGVVVLADGSGLRATINGEPAPTHQAFWFAWAQFNPGSELWSQP
jgi:hypothetical protein